MQYARSGGIVIVVITVAVGTGAGVDAASIEQHVLCSSGCISL